MPQKSKSPGSSYVVYIINNDGVVFSPEMAITWGSLIFRHSLDIGLVRMTVQLSIVHLGYTINKYGWTNWTTTKIINVSAAFSRCRDDLWRKRMAGCAMVSGFEHCMIISDYPRHVSGYYF